MNQNKKYVFLTLLLCAAAMFCLLVPAYAAPHVRNGIVRDRDGIIEDGNPNSDSPSVTMPKVTGATSDNTMTPGGAGNDMIVPFGTGGALTSDATDGGTKSPSTTTNNTTAQSTTARPSVTTPNTDAGQERGNMAIWGVILAILVIAAIVVIIFLTMPKRR